ncbi:tetratricopeptide repeat protein [uncultured Desulfosarcina sp.]|uniref:tetratricopeptide repeat protein n=1 Tax=uncultured Desulfosarcina sp. TaxID=218289 RepID=UPI0029C8C2FE|nr:tetratricopeptide repeat protein [uncultured Desulfosarcina sp.]
MENKNAKDFFAAGMGEFALSRFDKSIDLLTRAIEADPSYTLAIVSRGAAFLKTDMLDRAQSDFDRAITINPDYARAYHLRGLVSEKRGDNHTALADFNRATELDPEYGAAYYSRAALHAKMANTEKAQGDIEMIAHLGCRNMETFMNENNVWQTQHMRVEDYLETELER